MDARPHENTPWLFCWDLEPKKYTSVWISTKQEKTFSGCAQKWTKVGYWGATGHLWLTEKLENIAYIWNQSKAVIIIYIGGDTDPQIFYMVKRPPQIYWCKIPKNTSYTTTGSHIKYASIQNNVFLTKPNQLPLSELLVVLPLLIYVMLLIFHVERHLCSEILILKFYFTIWCLSLLHSLSSLSSAFICLSGSNKSTCMLRFCG